MNNPKININNVELKVGDRILFNDKTGPREAEILEISPSCQWIKLSRLNNLTLDYWRPVSELVLIEKLGRAKKQRAELV